MFKTFVNAFKVKDIRRKLFYMLLMLVIIRIGSQIPVPGTDSTQLKAYLQAVLFLKQAMALKFSEMVN